MEGRVYSDFYRNTSEEIFMKTLMESSVGITAPTMEMLGFKNLSNNFRADSEELFKSWLDTGENQSHNPTGIVHNRSRQLSRMLTDQTSLPIHQNGVPPQTKKSSENITPPSISENGESSCDMNEHLVRNPQGKGLQASNLFLAKAWFNSSQPMTRSRSSELRRKYVAMLNSQTAIGIEAMQNESTKDFVNPCAFKEASVCDIPNPFNDLVSTCNSSSSTFNTPHTDKISSVVNMLKSTIESKKLGNSIDKECYYSNSNQVHEIHIPEAGRMFQDLTDTDINDSVLIQGLEGVINADLEGFVAPTNLIQMNVASREPSQSESSAAAPVISTGFDVSDGPSYSGQSPSVRQSPRKQFGNRKNTEIGVISNGTDIRGRMYDNLKEDHKPKGSLTRHGSVSSFASGDRGDPTKKRRVERSRKMAEAKEKTQTPATSSDMQSILKRCENLEKEVRSLKLNLAFMNRKDSEQTKQIEDLQKQNEDMGEEKERLLEEIERILSQTR